MVVVVVAASAAVGWEREIRVRSGADINVPLPLSSSTGELPKLPSYTVSDMWYETLGKFPNKEAIVSADTGAAMTFSDVERLSNKIANWCLAQGLKVCREVTGRRVVFL